MESKLTNPVCDKDSDIEPECSLSIHELKSWKVVELKAWLDKKNLKKSGNKEILIKRVFNYMTKYDNLYSSSDASSDEFDDMKVVPIFQVSNPWKPLDSSDIPAVSSKGVDSYFIYHKNPVTGERLNFERQQKKAKRLCNEGFVRDIEFNKVHDEAGYCYIRAKCLPSMRQTVQIGNCGNTAKFYSLHTCIVPKTGHILSANCNCKAGSAGLCAHVGALLYTLVKTKNACTSNECTWDRPRPLQRKPSPKRVYDINFVKTEKDNFVEKVKPYPGTYNAGPHKECSFLDDILDSLKDVQPQAVLYQTLRGDDFKINSFLSSYQPPFMYVDSVDLKSDVCTGVFRSFLDNINLSSALCQALERSTRGQGPNQNWLKARTCLITASVMGEVCRRTKVAPDNLLKKICGYTNVPKYVKSIAYGNANESVALSKYMQSHLQTCGDVFVETCGLLVNGKYPFLGASIDGLVTCSKCGTGLIEIKCPYGSDSAEIPWRNMPPIDCARDKNFFCQIVNGKFTLKETHNYMFQIQGQMAVYELSWVDFVVYTKKGINVERIRFSQTMWDTMQTQLKDFYLASIIPEFFSRRVQRGKSLYMS